MGKMLLDNFKLKKNKNKSLLELINWIDIEKIQLSPLNKLQKNKENIFSKTDYMNFLKNKGFNQSFYKFNSNNGNNNNILNKNDNIFT